MRLLSIVAALTLLTSASWAAELIQPNPAFAPEEAVAIQLKALQTNNAERTDDGIEQTWAFAHPSNKRMTGPLPRFTQMVKGPQYNMLLNHRAHQVEEALRAENRAIFIVTVVSKTGDAYECRWALEKVAAGKQAGAWMTTAVTTPQKLGQEV